jgi:predicted  nucleic acid-binding Zn ribbon protein
MAMPENTKSTNRPRVRNAWVLGAVGLCSAAAIVGSIVVPSPAHAAQINQAAAVGDSKQQVEQWQAGWNACKGLQPNTKSVQMDSKGGQYAGNNSRGELTDKWIAYWRCYDTTDGT